MNKSIFDQLRDSSGVIWEDYLYHPFVQGIENGTLSENQFKYYLIQDYLFLIQFGRAYALAAYKSDTVSDMRTAAYTMINIIDTEMQLHIEYCENWGVMSGSLSGKHEDLATTAYTRFVLDCGHRGDLLDLMTALSPCVVGYAEIGRNLARSKNYHATTNPYRSWVEMYSGKEYQSLAETSIQQLQDLFKKRGGPERFHLLESTFNQATRLEIAFWQMAWEQDA